MTEAIAATEPAEATQEVPSSMPELVDAMKDALRTFERACAVNTIFSKCADQAINGVQGQRKAGLPILTFSGALNGRDRLDLAVDLRSVDEESLPHVLVPLANSQMHLMLQEARLLQECSTKIINVLTAAMQP